jgi:hypothetical protein
MLGLGKRNVEFDGFVRKVVRFYQSVSDSRKSAGDCALQMSASLNSGIALTMGLCAGKRLEVYSSLIKELHMFMHRSIGDYGTFPAPTDPMREENYDLI